MPIHDIIMAAAGASSPATDPNFSSVVLLLHAEGAAGSTTFTDSGPSGRTVTTVGGNAQIDSTSKFGSGSIIFDGSGDFLSYASNSAFNLSGDFTFECFVRLTSATGTQELCARQGSVGGDGLYQFRINGTSLELVLCANSSASVFTLTSASGQFSTGVWYHVAATRSGTSIKLFVNGTQVATGTSSITATSTTRPFTIGCLNDTVGFGTYLNGRIDEFRLTLGVARYTANFTVPTEAFPNA